jgi:cyclic beta-1,2-glucan synthetase
LACLTLPWALRSRLPGIAGAGCPAAFHLETLAERRYRGHFYNWYDTRTLELLNPRYISTVDSGNLAACLIALKQGCREVAAAPVLRWESWKGFLDTLTLLDELLETLADPEVRQSAGEMRQMLAEIRAEVRHASGQIESWPELVVHLLDSEQTGWSAAELKLGELVEACAHAIGAEDLRRMRVFSSRVRTHLVGLQRVIEILMPWSRQLQELPDLFGRADLPPGIQQPWEALAASLNLDVGLSDLTKITREARSHLDRLQAGLEELDGKDPAVQAAEDWCDRLSRQLEEGGTAAKVLVIGFEEFQRQADAFVDEMDFTFLYDPERQVFHIGYNATEGRLDNNYYDLLASESRLASLVAIAKGEVPQSHWLHLSRPFTLVGGTRSLLSWSATMFEYLMPVPGSQLSRHSTIGGGG